MMKRNTNNTKNGAGRPLIGGVLEIVRMHRISQSQPTAWEGWTESGHKVHVGYRFGALTVNLRMPVKGIGWKWIPVLDFKPALVQAELEARRQGQGYVSRNNGKGFGQFRRERLAVAEGRITAEIRAANNSEARQRIVTLWELRGWLEERNTHLHSLLRLGVAGGRVPVRVTAIFDGKGSLKSSP